MGSNWSYLLFNDSAFEESTGYTWGDLAISMIGNFLFVVVFLTIFGWLRLKRPWCVLGRSCVHAAWFTPLRSRGRAYLHALHGATLGSRTTCRTTRARAARRSGGAHAARFFFRVAVSNQSNCRRRPHRRRWYASKRLVNPESVPSVELPSDGLFTWIMPLARIGEDEILRTAGYDVLMLLRFNKFLMRLTLFFAPCVLRHPRARVDAPPTPRHARAERRECLLPPCATTPSGRRRFGGAARARSAVPPATPPRARVARRTTTATRPHPPTHFARRRRARYAFLVLVPLALSSTYFENSPTRISSFFRATASNLRPGDPRLWANVVGMYYLTLIFVFLVDGELNAYQVMAHICSPAAHRQPDWKPRHALI